MASSISTLGAQLASISRLNKGTSTMATLSQQLASGVVTTDLTDYTSTEAKRLLDLNATLSKQKGYQDICKTINTRISAYDTALTGIESVAGLATTLVGSSVSYNSATNSTVASQVKGFMDQVSYFLNLKVGDRYVFSGTRYTTAPVVNLTTLPTLTTASTPTITTSPTLPEYDAQYNPPTTTTSAASFVQDNVSVDSTETLQYGITSNDPSFQNLILGLRYAYAATQDPTNYSTLMKQAQTYINTGLSSIQAVHSILSSNSATLDDVQTKLTNDVTDLSNSIADIQSVDTNEVSVKITALETALQAAYSATSKLIQLSILKYL